MAKPYTYDCPVVGRKQFIGRELMIRSLTKGVLTGRSFLISGGPKMGRTSAIAQLLMSLERQWYCRPRMTKLVPVYLDLATVPALSPVQLVQSLWSGLTSAIRNPRVVSGQITPAPDQSFTRTRDPWAALEQACADHWTRLKGTAGWCQYALLLDNGHLLANRAMSSSVTGLARLHLAERPGMPTALVFAASRIFREMTSDSRCPLNFLRPAPLTLFNDTEATTLVNRGFHDAEEDWQQQIFRLTGKHPYLLQRILAEFDNEGPDLPFAELLEEVAGELDALFEAIWEEFDLKRGITYRGAYAAPEHAVMQYLIHQDEPSKLRAVEKTLGIKTLKDQVDFLEYVGVVERVIRGDTPCYWAPFELWNRWYLERTMR